MGDKDSEAYLRWAEINNEPLRKDQILKRFQAKQGDSFIVHYAPESRMNYLIGYGRINYDKIFEMIEAGSSFVVLNMDTKEDITEYLLRKMYITMQKKKVLTASRSELLNLIRDS